MLLPTKQQLCGRQNLLPMLTGNETVSAIALVRSARILRRVMKN